MQAEQRVGRWYCGWHHFFVRHLRDWLLNAKSPIYMYKPRSKATKRKNRQSRPPASAASSSPALYLYQPWLPVSIIVKMYNCECIVWDSLEKADDVSAESFEQFPQPIPAELLFDGSDCCARTESELTLPSSKISLNFMSEWQKLKLPASNDGSFGLALFVIKTEVN